MKKFKELVRYSLSTTIPGSHNNKKNNCGKPGTGSELLAVFCSFLSSPKYAHKNGKLDFGDKDDNKQ